MKPALDRLFHSPWFILFLAAIPCVIGYTVFGMVRGKVVVESISVELLPTDMKGASWDPKGKPPDILIELDWDGDDHRCTRGEDSLVHTCEIGEELPRNARLTIDVSDGDAFVNDPAGSVTIDLSDAGATVERHGIDRIAHLTLRLAHASSVQQRYGTRLTAFGIGALVSLLAWIIFLRGWLGAGDKPVLAGDSVRWITLIAGTLALVGVGFGLAAVFSPETHIAYLAESPCGIGAAVVGLIWLHGRSRGEYTTTDGVLMFLGIAAILMPVMVMAAAVVGVILFAYVLLLALFD